MPGRDDCIKKAKVVTEAASSLLTGPSSGFLPNGGGAFLDCYMFTVLYQSCWEQSRELRMILTHGTYKTVGRP